MTFNPRKFTTKSGKTILVGRNSRDNNYLTLKVAEPNDVFFHATDFAGSHVILQLSNEEPSRADLEEAALLAAYYSKGKNKKAVKVDYTYRKYVSKPRKAPAGLVEIEKHKTIKISKEQLARLEKLLNISN